MGLVYPRRWPACTARTYVHPRSWWAIPPSSPASLYHGVSGLCVKPRVPPNVVFYIAGSEVCKEHAICTGESSSPENIMIFMLGAIAFVARSDKNVISLGCLSVSSR